MSDPLGVPSPWVRRFAHLVEKGGAVLDLAAGAGRHARFFAGRGHPVTAVDHNLDGMADLAADGPVARIRADLEDGSPWPLGDRQFAGIVVTNYLHRPLLPILADALTPGGVLIYETFAVGQGEFGRPSSENYLLRPNELIRVFGPLLTVVGFEHGIDYAPNPKAVQRLAAVKGRDLVPL
ncbi:MAG TPA: class I SAM-dependent methyltransferase [Aliidongia sp.]|uniref:class I SAM-dependent methyltransferase n=1 Tax=Aliidongia sp. TaxID=1914230 RepID=UPI002DDCA984|nr:class I SAM-dependent methyltransferase [Aliidongia sp.]HEV2675176.1 class I SAM-dependent methyltransferase [Aliidongia sp.]